MATQRFQELVRAGAGLAVDREAGVLRNVRVLGPVSRNGRRYLAEAVRKAVALYEGAPVRVDHRDPRQRQPRGCGEAFGRLKGLAVAPDGGLVARELHYNRFHPLAEQVIEDVERIDDLGLFGLSHDIEGDGRHAPDGVFEVAEIAKVYSVDLVAEPATTTNLREGVSPVKITLKALAAKQADPEKRRLLEAMYGRGETDGDEIRETDDDADLMADGDLEMELPPDAAPESDSALVSAIKDLIAGLFDDAAMSDADKIKKFKAFLKAHSLLTGKADDGADPGAATEAKRRKAPDAGQAILEAVDLLGQAGLAAERPLVEALVALPEGRRKAFVESLKKHSRPAAAKPKTGGQNLREAKGADQWLNPPSDPKDLAAFLLN